MEEILFTEKIAKIIAKEWVNKRVPVPEDRWRRYQKRWLMDQLAPQCIAETIRNKGGESELEQHLNETLELLDNIWYETAPAYAQFDPLVRSP